MPMPQFIIGKLGINAMLATLYLWNEILPVYHSISRFQLGSCC